MTERIDEVTSANLPWLVAEQFGRVVGYAYAAKWKGRSGYRLAVESTVYLDQDALGQGLGSQLYGALLALLKERGVHVVIGGIVLPNSASIAPPGAIRFQEGGPIFKEVGFKFNQWLDVGYWQLVL